MTGTEKIASDVNNVMVLYNVVAAECTIYGEILYTTFLSFFAVLSALGERLFSGFVGKFQQIFPIYFCVFPKIIKKDKNSFIGRYSERLELNQNFCGLNGCVLPAGRFCAY